jgi:hypothetical protein
MDRPHTIEEYLAWAKSAFSIDFNDRAYVNLYNANLNNAVNSISESAFYTGLDNKLQDWGEEYKLQTGSILLMDSGGLTLLKKPYSSAIDKSFRRNVLWNKRFPEEPQKGWMLPENFFATLNDVIRSTLVCKFIDGPSFLANKLAEYATGLSLDSTSYTQERDEGYYAQHFYVKFQIDLLDISLRDQQSELEIEIQLTTQLQDVLKSLTHHYYQQTRILSEKENTKWKWEYNTNRFRASYLSHTLHLLEAIIVQLRDEDNAIKSLLSETGDS